MSASCSMHLNRGEVAVNGGRPVYDVCHLGTEDLVGQIALGADDRWHVQGTEESFVMSVDAVRFIMEPS